jgi:hypothetical protein
MRLKRISADKMVATEYLRLSVERSDAPEPRAD